MAVTVDYNEIWKWINLDWDLYYDFYGADFNPQEFNIDGWTDLSVYGVTSSFNLSNFQPGHEVWCWLVILYPNGWSWKLYADFYRDGHYAWYYSWNVSVSSEESPWWWFIYFGIDKDEIRPWYSTYNIHYYSTDGEVDFWSPDFTVSNLSIDSSYHPAWYLWVEWSHLCYTDNTGDEVWMDGYWFKHKIAYDSSYSSNVWSENAWYIWLDENNYFQIYYVDAVWVRRRTYTSHERYWWAVNVWSWRKWYMRVWVDDESKWYGYLCFISPTWWKRRILNWPPIWYE